MALKLDIGCGGRGSRQKGFIGIDLYPRPNGKSREEYFRLNFVRDALPWKGNTVDEAIALHIIEHMPADQGEILVRRAVDLLKPGARLTVTCPDLMLLCKGFVDQGDFLKLKHLTGGKDVWPGETLADRFNWAIHQEGHQWAYDQASLIHHATKAVGTTAVVRPMPDDSPWWTRRDHETGIEILKR